MAFKKDKKIDPKNLSNLYFSDNDYDSCCLYVHPSIAIQDDDPTVVVHGRGMVVTQDIPAGECLFVTRPTVGVGMDEIKKRFLETREAAMNLEDIAIELLIDSMEEAIARRQQKEEESEMFSKNAATINSFMTLMGSTPSTKQEQRKVTTLDVLNATDDRLDLWSDEELDNVTRKDLRNIILKNGESQSCLKLGSAIFTSFPLKSYTTCPHHVESSPFSRSVRRFFQHLDPTLSHMRK
eukprot:scaffold2462_cov127-Cylindrotheca_fusiformis.AAC.19